jgi:DNA-directed RNA polymerase subunit K/omega
MSDEEMQQGEVVDVAEESRTPPEPAPPIESRFLYVDVAALRAKQLRRGAKPRLSETSEAESGPKPNKAERIAMAEVRNGLVEWNLPEFQAVIDNR